MSKTIVLELPEEVLLSALRQLSPDRRRWLFEESEKKTIMEARPVPASALDKWLGTTSIGGDALEDSGSVYYKNPTRDVMKREIEAYHQLHTALVATHLGEFVAIFQGQVVDHDEDPVALHQRVKTNFPEKIVLSRKVTVEPEPIVHMRSPRLERV